MRQHVNPLSSFFQLPLEIPPKDELFENSELPIHLDIGSARGKFLLAMAKLQPNRNYLGVEIRQTLVLKAEKERKALGLNNLRFIFCNANVSLEVWLGKMHNQNLDMVSIQFPDPWFKRRHRKRQVLQPSLLLSIANCLKPNSKLFVQSDVLDVINAMTSLIELSHCFDSSGSSEVKFIDESPFPVSTEREKLVLSVGYPVYRSLYIRNDKMIPKLLELEDKYSSLNASMQKKEDNKHL